MDKKEESVDMGLYEHPEGRKRVLVHDTGDCAFKVDHDAHEVRIDIPEDNASGSITVVALGRIGQHFAAISNYRFIVDGKPNKSFDEPAERTEGIKDVTIEMANLIEELVERFNAELPSEGVPLKSISPEDFDAENLKKDWPYGNMGRILMDGLVQFQPRVLGLAKSKLESGGELNEGDQHYVGSLVHHVGKVTNAQYDPRVFMAGLSDEEKMGYIEYLMLTEQACKHLASKAVSVISNPEDVKEGRTLIERGLELGTDQLKEDLSSVFHVRVPDDYGLNEAYLQELKTVAEKDHSTALH